MLSALTPSSASATAPAPATSPAQLTGAQTVIDLCSSDDDSEKTQAAPDPATGLNIARSAASVPSLELAQTDMSDFQQLLPPVPQSRKRKVSEYEREPPELSEYERVRLRNIAENHETLASLGLVKDTQPVASAGQSDEPAPSPVARKRPTLGPVEALVVNARQRVDVQNFSYARLTQRMDEGGEPFEETRTVLSYFTSNLVRLKQYPNDDFAESFCYELQDTVTQPTELRQTSNYEDEYMLLLARLLDNETSSSPCVPRYTSSFELTPVQRMQVAHLACLVSLEGLHRTVRVTGRLTDAIDMSLQLRGDGGLQSLQLLASPPGTGKTVIAIMALATLLCRRNWDSFVRRVQRDMLVTSSISQAYSSAPLQPIAIVVCPPNLVDQWASEAEAVLRGPDCRPGATFEAHSRFDWKIEISRNTVTTERLLAGSRGSQQPQLWIIASQNGLMRPYQPILSVSDVRVAVAVYDECTFTLSPETPKGGGYNSLMTILVTATPSALKGALVQNKMRNPLSAALQCAGATNNGSVITWVTDAYGNTSESMRDNIRSLLCAGRRWEAIPMIRCTMAMRLFVGPPELALLARNDALASMPVGVSTFDITFSHQTRAVATISLWRALCTHITNIQLLACENQQVVELAHRFGRCLHMHGIKHKGGSSGALELQEVYDTLLPIVDALAEKLVQEKLLQQRSKKSLRRLRHLMQALQELIASKDGVECGVCTHLIDASTPAGPTTCCGHIMCIKCAASLRELKCPFCREVAGSGFDIVQTAGDATPTPEQHILAQLPQSPVDADYHDDSATSIASSWVLEQACGIICRAKLGMESAFASAVHLSLMARKGSAPRVLVYFGKPDSRTPFCPARSFVDCSKSRIFDIADNAEVYHLDTEESPRSSGKLAQASNALAGIRAFRDDTKTTPVFLLCKLDVCAMTIAGTDLGMTTAAIIVGDVENDAAVQLMGRMMRRAQHKQPSLRVFCVTKRRTNDGVSWGMFS